MNKNETNYLFDCIEKNYHIEIMHEKSNDDIYLVLGAVKVQIDNCWVNAIRYRNKNNEKQEYVRLDNDLCKLRIVYLMKK